MNAVNVFIFTTLLLEASCQSIRPPKGKWRTPKPPEKTFDWDDTQDKDYRNFPNFPPGSRPNQFQGYQKPHSSFYNTDQRYWGHSPSPSYNYYDNYEPNFSHPRENPDKYDRGPDLRVRTLEILNKDVLATMIPGQALNVTCQAKVRFAGLRARENNFCEEFDLKIVGPRSSSEPVAGSMSFDGDCVLQASLVRTHGFVGGIYTCSISWGYQAYGSTSATVVLLTEAQIDAKKPAIKLSDKEKSVKNSEMRKPVRWQGSIDVGVKRFTWRDSFGEILCESNATATACVDKDKYKMARSTGSSTNQEDFELEISDMTNLDEGSYSLVAEKTPRFNNEVHFELTLPEVPVQPTLSGGKFLYQIGGLANVHCEYYHTSSSSAEMSFKKCNVLDLYECEDAPSKSLRPKQSQAGPYKLLAWSALVKHSGMLSCTVSKRGGVRTYVSAAICATDVLTEEAVYQEHDDHFALICRTSHCLEPKGLKTLTWYEMEQIGNFQAKRKKDATLTHGNSSTTATLILPKHGNGKVHYQCEVQHQDGGAPKLVGEIMLKLSLEELFPGMRTISDGSYLMYLSLMILIILIAAAIFIYIVRDSRRRTGRYLGWVGMKF